MVHGYTKKSSRATRARIYIYTKVVHLYISTHIYIYTSLRIYASIHLFTMFSLFASLPSATIPCAESVAVSSLWIRFPWPTVREPRGLTNAEGTGASGPRSFKHTHTPWPRDHRVCRTVAAVWNLCRTKRRTQLMSRPSNKHGDGVLVQCDDVDDPQQLPRQPHPDLLWWRTVLHAPVGRDEKTRAARCGQGIDTIFFRPLFSPLPKFAKPFFVKRCNCCKAGLTWTFFYRCR